MYIHFRTTPAMLQLKKWRKMLLYFCKLLTHRSPYKHSKHYLKISENFNDKNHGKSCRLKISYLQ